MALPMSTTSLPSLSSSARLSYTAPSVTSGTRRSLRGWLRSRFVVDFDLSRLELSEEMVCDDLFSQGPLDHFAGSAAGAADA